MMLVGMSDPGLLILPTHRLVSGFPGLTASELAARLEPEFEITEAGTGEAGCRAAWEQIEQAASRTCSASGRSPTADGCSPGSVPTPPWIGWPRSKAPTGAAWA